MAICTVFGVYVFRWLKTIIIRWCNILICYTFPSLIFTGSLNFSIKRHTVGQILLMICGDDDDDDDDDGDKGSSNMSSCRTWQKPVASYRRKTTKFCSSKSLTKLCHIKRNHLVNFYISLEKRENLWYICRSMSMAIKFGMVMHNVSQVHRLI